MRSRRVQLAVLLLLVAGCGLPGERQAATPRSKGRPARAIVALGGSVRPAPAPFGRIAMAPTGKLVAVGSREGTIHVVEVDTATPLLELDGHSVAFAFDEQGDFLHALSIDGHLTRTSLGDRTTTDLGALFELPPKQTLSSASHLEVRGGRILATSDHEVVVADAKTGERFARQTLLEARLGFVTALAPDGSQLAGVDDRDGRHLVVLDDHLRPLHTIPFSKNPALFVHALTFDGPSDVLVSATALNGNTSEVLRISLAKNAVVRARRGPSATTTCDTLQVLPPPRGILCSHHKNLRGPARVRWLSPDTFAETRAFDLSPGHTYFPNDPFADATGARLLVGTETPVVDVATGAPIGALALPWHPGTFVLGEDGRVAPTEDAAAGHAMRSEVALFGTGPGPCPGTARRGDLFACARSGARFARLVDQGIEVGTATGPRTLVVPPFRGIAVAMRDDGGQVAARDERGNTVVFDAASGQTLHSIPAAANAVADDVGVVAFLGDVLMISGRPARLVRLGPALDVVEVHHVPEIPRGAVSLAFVGKTHAWGHPAALARVGLRTSGGPALAASSLAPASPGEIARWLPLPTAGIDPDALLARATQFAAGGGKLAADERTSEFRWLAFEHGAASYVGSPWGARPLPPNAKRIGGAPGGRYALFTADKEIFFAFRGHASLVVDTVESPGGITRIRYATLPTLEEWGPLPVVTGPRGTIAIVPSQLPNRPPSRKSWGVPVLDQGTWPAVGAVPGGKTGSCRAEVPGNGHPIEGRSITMEVERGRITSFVAQNAHMASEWGMLGLELPYVGAAITEGAWMSVAGVGSDGKVQRYRLRVQGTAFSVEGAKDVGTCTWESP